MSYSRFFPIIFSFKTMTTNCTIFIYRMFYLSCFCVSFKIYENIYGRCIFTNIMFLYNSIKFVFHIFIVFISNSKGLDLRVRVVVLSIQEIHSRYSCKKYIPIVQHLFHQFKTITCKFSICFSCSSISCRLPIIKW